MITPSLSPSALPLFLPPSLPTSLPSSLSSLPPSSSRHLYLSRFPYSFPLFSVVYTPLPPRFRPPLVFLPILSFSLRRTWIRSWLFAHIYTNVEAIYVIQSNCVIPAMRH
ncbi:hypothetical protein NP493_329g02012 [Ridgeia piscesae]|uniref:Uncharacterized protein n=1 Tax=Ridgeia piscesae TaxID=27915 RepID=A0AAD9NU79_RIDPI|nr:hypothetical protein NP493_329g02012 [Ridgeia piscesae]